MSIKRLTLDERVQHLRSEKDKADKDRGSKILRSFDGHSVCDRDFFEIAKIIDPEYIGGGDYFRTKRVESSFIMLSSDKCDSTSNIRVYYRTSGIEKITRLFTGDFLDWYEIHDYYYHKIKEYLNSRQGCAL